MKIIRLYTKEPIQSLGVNSTFVASSSCVITFIPEFQSVRINSTIVPLSNVKEIIISDELVEEIKEPKSKAKKVEV